ncbi:MAG: tRNA uridine(34) 5-carboxymethylaminomethyl modification radical SAM/GNAT enzyme Elp3 [Candidatus Diapherotrites archaeon]|nr:tRNA uridine(34) 5-carboxymethylaminomethyl modification radical SAM/GNAT enzyme Elp3 [Candidatus Diapherotrites archaeon]
MVSQKKKTVFGLDSTRSFSLELLRLIESGAIKTKQQLNSEKIRLSKKRRLRQMPSDPDILLCAAQKTPAMRRLLSVKPTRSLSGIAVVAVMAPPHLCPGKCIYCPNSLLPGIETPKSYTGREPATMRAVQAKFSPLKQVSGRLSQLEEAGHNTGKLELIVMGGTFPSQPLAAQERFMLGCYNAVNGSSSRSLAAAMRISETVPCRVTGVTFETRPDFCGKKEISRMLSFGGTRCELGVQTIYDAVYKRINRGHTVADVAKATQLLRDSAFKVTYHCMPGLPEVSLKQDRKALLKIFSDARFKPDSLKIYPTLVIEGTKLFEQWSKGKYSPLSTEDAVELLASVKRRVPRWMRIMRIQRDIPAQLIAAGVQKSNLRQIVQQEMAAHGWRCNCIRCREAGLLSRKQKSAAAPGEAAIFLERYKAGGGKEVFISFEDRAHESLFGFLRLRLPFKPFRLEISPGTALVRELRVFGKPLALHARSKEAMQHRGIGRMLLAEAERVAVSDFGAEKLLVISGTGVKEYYRWLGFSDDGAFVSKKI